jgi:hypothetical protein
MCESKPIKEAFGTIVWRLPDNTIYNPNGPAVVRVDGYKAWYINDKRHRTDGPAVEYADGHKSWWIDDINYSFDEFIIEAKWTQEEIAIWKLQHA